MIEVRKSVDGSCVLVHSPECIELVDGKFVSKEDRPTNVKVEFGDLVRLRDYPGECGTVDTIIYRDNKPSMIWYRNEIRGGNLDWSSAQDFELYWKGEWVDIVSEEDTTKHLAEFVEVTISLEPKNPAVDWVSLTEYPHACTHCGAPSYNGLNRVDCSAGCNER